MADQRIYSGWKQNKWLANVLGEESKVAKQQNVLTQCVKKILNEKRVRNSRDVSCLLDVLVTNEELSQDEIAATVVGFIVLGFDRLASTTCFALIELSKQVEAQEKIRREIGENFPIESQAAIKSLKSLGSFLLETHRLYPAASVIAKWITEGVALSGFFIPPNSSILLYLSGTARDAQRFSNPEKFDTNRRHLNETFGASSHENNMPMTVMKVLVGNLVKNYQLRRGKEEVKIGSGLTLRADGVRMNIKSR